MQLRHRCPHGGVHHPDLALPAVLARDPRSNGGQGGEVQRSCIKRLPDGSERPGTHTSRRLAAWGIMQLEKERF